MGRSRQVGSGGRWRLPRGRSSEGWAAERPQIPAKIRRGSALRFLGRWHETNGALGGGRRRRFQQILQYFEDGVQIGVVLADFTLESFHLSGQVLMGRQYLPQIHKRADDLDARTNRDGALEHVGEHYGSVLGEDVRPVLNIPAAFQGHRL